MTLVLYRVLLNINSHFLSLDHFLHTPLLYGGHYYLDERAEQPGTTYVVSNLKYIKYKFQFI